MNGCIYLYKMRCNIIYYATYFNNILFTRIYIYTHRSTQCHRCLVSFFGQKLHRAEQEIQGVIFTILKIKYRVIVRSILPACDLPCCQVLSDLGDASTKHCRVTCMSTARSTTGLTTRTRGSTVELKPEDLMIYLKDIRSKYADSFSSLCILDIIK